MESIVADQLRNFEQKYVADGLQKWAFHDTPDPLMRYLRDRRIKLGIDRVLAMTKLDPATCSVLVVCGGVGGEGTYLANRGFRNVTVSDFSENALEICRRRDSRLRTRIDNAEAVDLPDASYDIVLVQDGLHHLPRPVLGFTEMVRVCRHAAIVIEPHTGLVGRVLGRQWEYEGDAVNYVFRWNHNLLEQATRSYLLRRPCYVKAIRFWDHNVALRKLAGLFGGGQIGLLAAKTAYGVLGAVPWLGNMMVGVVVKQVEGHSSSR